MNHMETTPTPPVPPVQQYAPQHMPPTHSRGPMIAAAVVVGIIVIAGAVFAYTKLANKPAETPSPTPTTSVSASTTPDPTAGWKTYTNTDLGFTVNYPSQATVSTALPAGLAITPLAYVGFMSGADRVDLYVVRQQDWKKPGGEGSYDDFFQEFTNPTTGAKTYVSVYTNSSPAAQWASQILSSFTFISATSGWKTYTNTQYGFEFKYPAEWPALEESLEQVYLIGGFGPVLLGPCEGADCYSSGFSVNSAPLSTFGSDAPETPERLLAYISKTNNVANIQRVISDTVSNNMRVISWETAGGIGITVYRIDLFRPATNRTFHIQFWTLGKKITLDQILSTFTFTK